MAETRDAVVIGSGFGGSIAALRLAESGRDVLVLEWGGRNTAKDFRQSWDPRYLQTLYTAVPSSDYEALFRYARTLGGGSVLFSGMMLRSPSEVFEWVDETGYKPWPDGITRSLMSPYYEKVEKMMSVSQARWDEVPAGGTFFAALIQAAGKKADRGRFPYVGCVQCGFCEAACIYDAKKSLILNYIPAAEGLGAEFRTSCKAMTIKTEGAGYRVTYRDPFGTTKEVDAPLVCIACNAVEDAALLLRSAPYLDKLSDQVGRNFTNSGDLAWLWLLKKPFYENMAIWRGRTNAVMQTYGWWRSHLIHMHTGSTPPGIFGGLDVRRRGGGSPDLSWGLDHKHFAFEVYRNRLVPCQLSGMVKGEGTVRIDGTGRAIIDLPVTPVFQAYMDKVRRVAEEIAAASDAEVLDVAPRGFERGGAHLQGTCRIGASPDAAVCDPYGEVFNYKGLFVTDGGSVPSGTGVNPSLTISANAERIAEYIVGNVKS
ncbi:MAG: GMC family oxidoreductase [Nitrospirae bacterium]|nr:GMC family oxidoreductase [Nitrospirota bacterium]